ncbi:Ig-like domain-containing protein [Mycolicibacterium palauense]|uniref:Ig-like domain-containing protein n=1 Tax=Mycolicibacterium palauense TaxID=2034511 RepID=UPI00159B9489|nr:Ig-like domain-containing protein [Mycolicibacterium palauense]
MSAQQHIPWVAGAAVSAGIGAAVLFGGAAVAHAAPSDSSSVSGSRSDSGGDGGDSSKRGTAAAADTANNHGDASDAAGDDDGAGEGADEGGDFSDVATLSSARSKETAGDERGVEDADAPELDAADLDAPDLDAADPDAADPDADDTHADDSVPGEDTAAGEDADGGDPPLPVAPQAADRTAADSADAAQAPNSAPTATTTVEDPDPLTGVTNVTVTGEDPDGDTLSYAATRATFGRVVGDGGGAFTYTPTTFSRVVARFVPFLRSDRFAVTVSDGRGGTVSSTVITAIVPVNRAPRARASTVNAPVPDSGVVTGQARAVDPNWDTVTFRASTAQPGKGSVTVNPDGTFRYSPTAEARHTAASDTASPAERTDTFGVTAVDAYGAVTDIAVTVTISPFNTAPTGAATVSDPDPASGVVTGRVIGVDADGDGLTYGGSTTTAKGTVVVGLDGAIVYSPTEIARRNASSVYSTPALRSDTFGVTVSDGYGGVTTVAVRVAVTPDTSSPAAVPPSTFCGCTLMPADTIFHADVRDVPVLPESLGWIELLGGARGATLRARWGGSEWMGSTAGIPVNVVGAEHPTETVIFNRGYTTSGPGIDESPYAIPDRPLVEGMPSYPAWDRHLFVFREGTCISQELINVANGVELPGAGVLDILGNAVYRSIWGSSWIAQAGVHYDMSSARYPAIGSANASWLPQVPTMLRPDEIERGYVDHMLGITIAKDLGAGYVWPARGGDGSGADGVPMGMVFRLREDVDLSGYAASTQAVLRALQVHGAVVYDSSGPGGEGMGLAAMSNGWEGTDFLDMQRELGTVPVRWFEAVDVVGLAADPASGWQIR